MSFYSERVFPLIEPLFSQRLWRERKRLIENTKGKVLEIGAGVGNSFDFLPERVETCLTVDPSTGFTKIAKNNSLKSNTSASTFVFRGDAQDLPFKSEQFDSVISFLVLCSVPKQERVLAEIYRVLRPGGNFVFFEHVMAQKKLIAKTQYLINPLWKIIACGCSLTHDTASNIINSGLIVDSLERYQSTRMGFAITANVIEGVAHRLHY